MKCFCTDQFDLPLPDGHRFPLAKYALLRQRVERLGLADELLPAPAATDRQLALVHEDAYLQRVVEGRLTDAEVRRIGFPWSPAMVERSRRSTGATIAAARAALADGVAANLAGGTHHASATGGEGYCVFNDVAVAIRVLQQEHGIGRAVVIDCDVHQGNGTAAIFDGDQSVATYSIHGAKNFPLRKVAGTVDVPLPDGVGDAAYLDALHLSLPPLIERAGAEMAYYLAGADAFRGDRLGRMDLSKDGLARRDRFVFETCRRAGLPVVVTMAGGYAEDLADIVDIHTTAIRLARELLFVGMGATTAQQR